MVTTHTEEGKGNYQRKSRNALRRRQENAQADSKYAMDRCAISLLNSRPSTKTMFYILLGGVCKDPA